MNSKPAIFDFTDYRLFLKTYYETRKARDPNFSFRIMAHDAGFVSTGFLKLVMDGARRLTQKSAAKTARALKLSIEDTEYFIALVEFCDAADDGARNTAFCKLKAIRRFRELKKLDTARFEYFRHWYHMAIREMVSLEDFREDEEWIAGRLAFAFAPRNVLRTVNKLEKLGFLVRNSEGKLQQATPVVHTEAEITDQFEALTVRNLQREMMDRAKEALDTCPPEKRDFRTLTVAISREQARKIKEMNLLHMKMVLEVVMEDEPIEEVYQLNFQLFPLTSDLPKNAVFEEIDDGE